jgi:2-desacetyl-2-hydroxyethyl bacteriochlorophyllide A dehydrogenase
MGWHVKGIVYRGPGQVGVEELAQPRLIHERDAVVRVTRAGICGTDLHPYRGEIPDFASGTVLGHEFAGTVHEAGAETGLSVGQRVFASDIIACGRCLECAAGWHYHCPDVSLFGYSTVVGADVAGGQAEFVRVPYADVVLAETPDNVSDEQALLVGDVLSTAYAAVRAARITPGDVVAVVGAGPVGLLAAMCAAAVGAGTVVLADPVSARQSGARAHGFSAVGPGELEAVVRDLTGGRGAGAVVEAVGSDAALRRALEVAGAHSTVAVVGAHQSADAPVPTRLAFARELTLRFVVGNPIASRAQVLALIQSGLVDPATVITHRIPLAAATSAYAGFDAHDAAKTVLLVADGTAT